MASAPTTPALNTGKSSPMEGKTRSPKHNGKVFYATVGRKSHGFVRSVKQRIVQDKPVEQGNDENTRSPITPTRQKWSWSSLRSRDSCSQTIGNSSGTGLDGPSPNLTRNPARSVSSSDSYPSIFTLCDGTNRRESTEVSSKPSAKSQSSCDAPPKVRFESIMLDFRHMSERVLRDVGKKYDCPPNFSRKLIRTPCHLSEASEDLQGKSVPVTPNTSDCRPAMTPLPTPRSSEYDLPLVSNEAMDEAVASVRDETKEAPSHPKTLALSQQESDDKNFVVHYTTDLEQDSNDKTFVVHYPPTIRSEQARALYFHDAEKALYNCCLFTRDSEFGFSDTLVWVSEPGEKTTIYVLPSWVTPNQKQLTRSYANWALISGLPTYSPARGSMEVSAHRTEPSSASETHNTPDQTVATTKEDDDYAVLDAALHKLREAGYQLVKFTLDDAILHEQKQMEARIRQWNTTPAPKVSVSSVSNASNTFCSALCGGVESMVPPSSSLESDDKPSVQQGTLQKNCLEEAEHNLSGFLEYYQEATGSVDIKDAIEDTLSDNESMTEGSTVIFDANWDFELAT